MGRGPSNPGRLPHRSIMRVVRERVTFRDTLSRLWQLRRSRDGRLVFGFVFAGWAALFAANWVFHGLLVAALVGVALIVATLGLWHVRRRFGPRRDNDAR
jgi:Flp pilus assembly protein TadB